MKAFISSLKERYQRALAAAEVEPEVRPFVNLKQIRDGAFGYECQTDAELMRNVGSVNRLRLAEVVRASVKGALIVTVPLVAGLGVVGYLAATTHATPIRLEPAGSMFAARTVSSEEIASLQSSIQSTMTARLAGSYAKVLQDGISTRYPNWNQDQITAGDFNAAVKIPAAEQQAYASKCASKIASGYSCSSQESILYRFINFQDGVSATSAEEAQKVFLMSGKALRESYLAGSKFDDICNANHSEKAFFGALSQDEAAALVSEAKRAWLDTPEQKLPEGFAKASGKRELTKASSVKGCALQPAMRLDVDAGPFKNLLQVYYRPSGKYAVEGVWIGLAEDKGQRVARLMGCSSESCSNSFGLDRMDYSKSGKAVDFLTSITAEGK